MSDVPLDRVESLVSDIGQEIARVRITPVYTNWEFAWQQGSIYHLEGVRKKLRAIVAEFID